MTDTRITADEVRAIKAICDCVTSIEYGGASCCVVMRGKSSGPLSIRAKATSVGTPRRTWYSGEFTVPSMKAADIALSIMAKRGAANEPGFFSGIDPDDYNWRIWAFFDDEHVEMCRKLYEAE